MRGSYIPIWFSDNKIQYLIVAEFNKLVEYNILVMVYYTTAWLSFGQELKGYNNNINNNTSVKWTLDGNEQIYS